MRWQLAVALVCALGVSQTSCGSKAECGSGTTERSGRCVVSDDASSIECGAGTREEDGVCVVERVACGAGAMLDANSGACVATDSGACGPNTAFDAASASCVPIDSVCAMGTTFDVAMGVCISDITCEAGDIVVDGLCVAPFDVLWDAATVSSTEPDDPFLSGDAQPIALAPRGTELVLSGTIDVPTDVDGDGVLDPDLDGFEFTTTGPQWLIVSVQSDTDALIGFTFANEDETWRRSSPLAGPLGNARGVLVPQAGTYRLGIGTPVAGHGVGSRWVASVKADLMPAPRTFTFGRDLIGSLRALETGHMIASEFSGFAKLRAIEWPHGSAYALMVFDGVSWIQAARFDDFQRTQSVVGAAPLQMFVDPIEYSPRYAQDYRILTAESVTVDLGTIAPGQTFVSAPVTDRDTVFTVEAPAGVVVEVSTTSTDRVDVELQAPYLSFRVVEPGLPLPIPIPTAATMAFSVSSSARAPFVVSIEAITPTDLGTVPSRSTLTETLGSLDGWAYYTVAFTPPELGRIRQTNAMEEALFVSTWGSDWSTQDTEYLSDRGIEFEAPVEIEGAIGPQLFGFQSRFSPLTDLELTFQGVGTTGLGPFGIGDTIAAADPVSRLRAEDAYFSFTLTTDARLSGALSAEGADLSVRITTSAGSDVWSDFLPGAAVVDVFLQAGDYNIVVMPDEDLPTGFTVDIDVEGLPTTTEVEPNDTVAMASVGLALGADVVGTGGPDVDWYSFTVTNPGIFTARVVPLFPGFSFPGVGLADTLGTFLTPGHFGRSQRGFLEAGKYTVRVDSFHDYILSIGRDDSNADFDDAGSNDTAATAQAISTAPGTTVIGTLMAPDEDWYAFTLAAPVGLYWSAVSTTGSSLWGFVELLDSTATVVTPDAGAYNLAAGSYYLHVSGNFFRGFPDYVITFGALPGTAYSSAPALAIPDAGLPAMVSDVVNVPAPCTIANVAVQIDVTHARVAELEIHAVSPSGTDVTLWFHDWTPELVGIFDVSLTSDESIDAFIGEEAMGDWTITLGDGSAGETGTLNSWGVLFDCQ